MNCSLNCLKGDYTGDSIGALRRARGVEFAFFLAGRESVREHSIVSDLDWE